jgi:hypothetical protein
LAVDRCIDRHAGLIENGAACGIDVANVGKVEPLAPPLPVVDVQKREAVREDIDLAIRHGDRTDSGLHVTRLCTEAALGAPARAQEQETPLKVGPTKVPCR